MNRAASCHRYEPSRVGPAVRIVATTRVRRNLLANLHEVSVSSTAESRRETHPRIGPLDVAGQDGNAIGPTMNST